MNYTLKWVSMGIFMLTFGGLATAQDYSVQHDRAAYAGLYVSMKFGAAEASHVQPVSYGFSAGFRKSNFGKNSSYYGSQFGHRDANLNMLDDKDWQARVVDLNFSDRGFEELSLAGIKFAQRHVSGDMVYWGKRYATDGVAEKEYGYDWGDIALGTLTVIGVVAVISFTRLG